MKLAAIGSNCIDYYADIEGGRAYPGGGPVNMAVYVKRLGSDSSYIGHIGNDKFGDLMKASIAERGVDISHLHVMPGKTAVTQVKLDNGERILGDYDEGVLANYCLSDNDIDFICKHDIVVCDLWGKVEGQFEELHSRGIKTAFDCATEPFSSASKIAIPYTDYLFFSDDESNTEEIKAQLQELQSQGPELVIAMLGEKGSLCFDGKDFHEFGIIECDNVVDTMGAGDSYIAGFLSAIGEGAEVDEAMKIGALTATETIQYFGA